MAERQQEDKILLWMFKNDKQNDRQPEYTGPGRINKDVLKELVEAYKKYGDADSLKLRCASWQREGKNGPYLFVTIEPDLPKEGLPEASDIPF
jgi:hypothetical protein